MSMYHYLCFPNTLFILLGLTLTQYFYICTAICNTVLDKHEVLVICYIANFKKPLQ